MNQAVVFSVPGRPVPAVRMTQNETKLMRYGRHPTNKALQQKYDRIKRYLDYKEAVAWSAKGAQTPFYDGELTIEINIYTNGVTGDWDNYGKSICDGLKGVAYKDDRQVKVGRVAIHKCEKGKERATVLMAEKEMEG